MTTDLLVALIDDLRRQASEQVGFVPRERLRAALEADAIQIAFENGEPCGYLYHGPVRHGLDLVIYQAVIHYDLRRRKHGADLVRRVVALAEGGDAAGVRLRCRSDIEANAFWRSMGFSCVSVAASGARRNTDVNSWRRPIRPGLFDAIVSTPSERQKDMATYNRAYLARRS